MIEVSFDIKVNTEKHFVSLFISQKTCKANKYVHIADMQSYYIGGCHIVGSCVDTRVFPLPGATPVTGMVWWFARPVWDTET